MLLHPVDPLAVGKDNRTGRFAKSSDFSIQVEAVRTIEPLGISRISDTLAMHRAKHSTGYDTGGNSSILRNRDGW